MSFELPDALNIADLFLDARLREQSGDRIAIVTDQRSSSYAEVQALSNRFANVLSRLDVRPEERVLIGLPDLPEFVAALFGTLKNGSVVVMVNCQLKTEEIRYFYQYTRARIAVVHAEHLAQFWDAAQELPDLRYLLVSGPFSAGSATPVSGRTPARKLSLERELESAGTTFENYPTHRDDAAIWLFSGGTTGRPKAVIQTHGSFANTTELYAKRVLGYSAQDRTLSVPKLYFGYATGCNLFFPFSVGASAILFPERCTAEVLFEKIRRHRPSILINVPTMVKSMLGHPSAGEQDLSCLRLATSAGEALPVELYQRFKQQFGVELLDGLGTAEMWHIFVSNRPGDVTPGTLGKVVPGFELRVCDDEGRELPDGEVGWLWVRGASRALGYFHDVAKTAQAFKGDWYVSGDMIRKNPDGSVEYCGRGDDMLKVGGKWLAPSEVENCLLSHPLVEECVVVGVVDEHGLTKPHAFVVARESAPELAQELQQFVRDRLEPYKAPRQVAFLDVLPRTHLGKVDRGKLRKS